LQWLEDNPGGCLSSEGNSVAGGQAGPEPLISVLHFSPASPRRKAAPVSKGGNSGREQLKACLPQTHLHPSTHCPGSPGASARVSGPTQTLAAHRLSHPSAQMPKL